MGSIQQELRVIIVGAGLAGLTIAHGLKKNGIAFSVFEKEPSPRERNWGVTISWAAPYLEKCLSPELFARLKECQPDPGLDAKARNQESVLIRNGKTGKTLVEPTFPGIRRLSIKKTRDNLGKGIDVQYGKEVIDIKTTAEGVVTAYFADGTKKSGSALIGTDGGGSYVRRCLLGDAATPWELGYNFVNFSFSLEAEQARWIDARINPHVDVGCHPDKPMYSGVFILDKPDLDRPETWVFYILSTWPVEKGVEYRPEDNLLEEYRSRMDGWGDPYKQVAEWIPDSTRVKAVSSGLKTFAPKSQWDNHQGLITIGGDAAHSVSRTQRSIS
jgi:2-polyprenyl-6-methoxyphenol hydroxylase-like FAD-dependent oxidoreductase